ncbi:MAG: hypothetical protein R2697_20645 [Ilumatobacteraceae bacterium]
MIDLVGRIIELDQRLTEGDIPHAFGGALALAWCTQQARGTIDIDVNVFLPADTFDRVETALPDGVEITDRNRREIADDGQTRLWWDRVPVDIFFNTTRFHDDAAGRARCESSPVDRFRSCRAPTSPCSRPSSTVPRTGSISPNARRRQSRRRTDRRRPRHLPRAGRPRVARLVTLTADST